MDRYDIEKLNLQIKNLNGLFKEIHFFPEIDSTNSHFKNNLNRYNSGDIIFADMQSEGRGRQNRKWISNAKDGLYFSILLKNSWDLKAVNLLTLIFAVSINRTLKNLGFNSKIKWPNDIFINNKKVAGILTENIVTTFNNTIIGIGININNKFFNSELSERATSLYLESDSENIGKAKVLYSILKNLSTDINSYTVDFNTESFIQYIRSNSLNLNKDITIRTGEKEVHGRLKDILNDGSILIIDKKNHSHIFNYGEII